MKKLFLLLFAFILFAGCAEAALDVIKVEIPLLGEEKVASVGDTFFEFTQMGEFGSPDNWKFDLTSLN